MNKYHDFSTNDTTHNAASHQTRWIPTNRSETYTFLATIMLMAVIKRNIRSLTTGQLIQ